MASGAKLRIAIFHMGFFYSGGGERLVLMEARELRARGHEVSLYAPIVDQRRCYPEFIGEVGPRSLAPWVPNVLGVGHALALLWSSALARRLTRPIVADVYLGANQPGAHLARAAAIGHRRPYVVYLNQPNRLLAPRGVDLETRSLVIKRDFFVLDAIASFGRPLLNVLDRVSVRDAAVRLGDGTYMTAQLRTYYGGEWRSCPAATAPETVEPTDQRDRSRAQVVIGRRTIRGPYLLLTNRHYPQKRFEWMFPVLEAARTVVPSLNLVITGQENAYTDRLRAEVERRGLQKAVRFLGLVSERELVALYRGAAVYVYPSPEEDFGMGIVEAMGQGTPVVAWNAGGPTGIMEDGCSGRLIEPGDHDAFARAVVELLQDHDLRERIGRAGWRRASEKFSWAAHTDTLERALYDAVAT